MEQLWKYLLNQFLVVTNSNYKKAVKLSNYHDAALKLKSDLEPLLIPIYNRYHALHLILISEYNSWKSAAGNQGGQTLNVEKLLDITYSNMQRWDITIQANGELFIKGSPNYQAIFMDGRKPFIAGSIDGRINAYDTLAKNMAPFAPLEEVMTQVAEAYTKLDDARDAQLGAKGNLKSGSGKVEDARKTAMIMQWRNLGFCMDAFWERPKYIESLFDVQTLREGRQRVFTGTLAPTKKEAILTHTFLADDELRLKNTGNAAINFYLGSASGNTNSNVVVVAPNSEEHIIVSQFGALNFGTHRFLTAVNESADVATHYEVEVL